MSGFFRRNRTILIVLLVAVLAVSGFIYIRRRNASAVPQYQTQAIERGNLTATIGATGTVRAKQTALLAWQAPGSVEVVNVKVGDNVPSGFVMAYLTKTSLPQNIILAEADLADAQSTLDDLLNSDTALAQSVITLRDATDAYNRAVNYRKQLNGKVHLTKIIYKRFGNYLVPVVKHYRSYPDDTARAKADEQVALKKAQLDDAQRDFDRLSGGNKDAIIAAQARLAAAQATLNQAQIVAPFGGIVTDADPLPGDQVTAGMNAFRLDDLSSLYVDVEVSEVDINNVAPGQPVTLSFDAILGRVYHGEVVEVAQTGTTSQGVVNFVVTVELTDADSLVKPGMTAAANITVKQLDDVLLVPNRAVRLSDGQRVVYLLVDGKAVKTDVSLGLSSDTQSVVTGGDIKPGDNVIINPPTEFNGPGRGPRANAGG